MRRTLAGIDFKEEPSQRPKIIIRYPIAFALKVNTEADLLAAHTGGRVSTCLRAATKGSVKKQFFGSHWIDCRKIYQGRAWKQIP